jgi:hypothetical protein
MSPLSSGGNGRPPRADFSSTLSSRLASDASFSSPMIQPPVRWNVPGPWGRPEGLRSGRPRCCARTHDGGHVLGLSDRTVELPNLGATVLEVHPPQNLVVGDVQRETAGDEHGRPSRSRVVGVNEGQPGTGRQAEPTTRADRNEERHRNDHPRSGPFRHGAHCLNSALCWCGHRTTPNLPHVVSSVAARDYQRQPGRLSLTEGPRSAQSVRSSGPCHLQRESTDQ